MPQRNTQARSHSYGVTWGLPREDGRSRRRVSLAVSGGRRIAAGILSICLLGAASCSRQGDAAGYVEKLASDNPAVRDQAIMMIGSLQVEEAVPKLKTFLNERWPTETRILTVRALGQLGATNTVDDVVQVFSTSDGPLKIAAAEALGKLADLRAVPALVNELSDTNVCLVAIWALGNIGDSNAVPGLVRVLSSSDKFTRYNARQALKRIGNRE